MAEQRDIKHFDYIDSLRGIAILLVMMVHVVQSTPGASFLLSYMASRGQFGVQLFFIVSAVTLLLSYEQRYQKDGKQADKFFFIRRYFRIAPMFYVAIVFYTVVLLMNNHYQFSGLPWLNIVIPFLFLQTFYPPAINFIPPGGWTVATEMLFYLCIPWLFRTIRSLKRAIWFFVATFALSIFLRWSILTAALLLLHKKVEGGWYLYFWLPNQLPVFAVGIVCYHVLRNPRVLALFKQRNLLFGSGVWAILVFLVGYRYSALPQHILISLSFGGLLLATAMSRIRIFQNWFFAFFGKVSFSLYLVHFFVISQLARILPVQGIAPVIHFIVLYVAVAAVGAIVAWLTYTFVEQPGIAWGRRLIANLCRP